MEKSNSVITSPCIDLCSENGLEEFISNILQPAQLDSNTSNQINTTQLTSPKTEHLSRKRPRSDSEPSDFQEEVHSDKKARRRLQNRVAAQNSRLRKKHHVEDLEGKNDLLLEENKRLTGTVQNLSNENDKLRQQLAELHKQLLSKDTSPTLSFSSSPLNQFTPIESAALNRFSPQMECGMVKKTARLNARSISSLIHLIPILHQSIVTIMSTYLMTLWCLWGWKICIIQQTSQFLAQQQILISGEKINRESVNNIFEFSIPTRMVNFYFRRHKRKRRKKKFGQEKINIFNNLLLLSSTHFLSLQYQKEQAVTTLALLLFFVSLQNVASYAFTTNCTNTTNFISNTHDKRSFLNEYYPPKLVVF